MKALQKIQAAALAQASTNPEVRSHLSERAKYLMATAIVATLGSLAPSDDAHAQTSKQDAVCSAAGIGSAAGAIVAGVYTRKSSKGRRAAAVIGGGLVGALAGNSLCNSDQYLSDRALREAQREFKRGERVHAIDPFISDPLVDGMRRGQSGAPLSAIDSSKLNRLAMAAIERKAQWAEAAKSLRTSSKSVGTGNVIEAHTAYVAATYDYADAVKRLYVGRPASAGDPGMTPRDVATHIEVLGGLLATIDTPNQKALDYGALQRQERAIKAEYPAYATTMKSAGVRL